MKRHSISAVHDKVVVRAVNSLDPELAAEALLRLLLALFEANAGAKNLDLAAPTAGDAAAPLFDDSALAQFGV